jgi:hypothetical protein
MGSAQADAGHDLPDHRRAAGSAVGLIYFGGLATLPPAISWRLVSVHAVGGLGG